MKKFDQIGRKLLAGGIALAMALPVTRAAAENVHQVIQVVRVEGTVNYQSSPNAQWKDVHPGDVYEAGTVIRTADSSFVDVMLGDQGSAKVSLAGTAMMSPDGTPPSGGGGGGGASSQEATANMIRIFPLSVLSVDKLTLDRTGTDETSETQLDLRAGQIMSNTKKLSAQSHYEIKIPTGVAGIRGNCNLLSINAKCASIEGTVLEVLINAANVPVQHEIPEKKMYDPGLDRVVDIPDKDYKDYKKLRDDLCRSAPPAPPHHEHDHTYDHHSNTDGSPK